MLEAIYSKVGVLHHHKNINGRRFSPIVGYAKTNFNEPAEEMDSLEDSTRSLCWMYESQRNAFYLGVDILLIEVTDLRFPHLYSRHNNRVRWKKEFVANHGDTKRQECWELRISLIINAHTWWSPNLITTTSLYRSPFIR